MGPDANAGAELDASVMAGLDVGADAQQDAGAAAPSDAGVGTAPAAKEATLIYDAECPLCAGAVRELRRGPGEGRIGWVALGSDEARKALERAGASEVEGDTVLLVDSEGVHDRSAAILRAAELAGGRASRILWLRFVPGRIRDGAYRLVARHRHRWPAKRRGPD